MTDLLHRVERFIFDEAELLDEWRLEEWLALFTDDAVYSIPPTGRCDADPAREAFLAHDTRFLLGQRVASLSSRSAHAESPRSTTRRLITNIVVQRAADDVVAEANFFIQRFRRGEVTTFVGRYHHTLEDTGTSFRFRLRRALLDHDDLRAQRSIGFIL